MSELIWKGSVRQDKYVELLKQRDRLRKVAFQLSREYIRVFGDKILEIFEKKIECIRKKKMIAYCQAAINRGEAIDQQALQAYLALQMKEYRKQLENMLREKEISDQMTDISQIELLKIKRIYHKIAKLIHPDIFPRTQEEPLLMELWLRTVAAYECNDLTAITECEALVNRAVAQLGIEPTDMEIPDIEEKIKALQDEIERIKQTDPYQYKFLLDDEDAVKEKMDSLDEELRSYEEYDDELETMLETIMGNGGVIAWHMN